jgi:hypothetical protein
LLEGSKEQWGRDYEEGKDMGWREREEKGAAEEEEEENLKTSTRGSRDGLLLVLLIALVCSLPH